MNILFFWQQMNTQTKRHPFPLFTIENAQEKVQLAEDAWSSRDLECVALAYTEDSEWLNRSGFINGRTAIIDFLQRMWSRELNDKQKKILWALTDNRIGVRYEYEWQASAGQWYRSHGNENWGYDENSLMVRHMAYAVPLACFFREEKSTCTEDFESAKAMAS